MHARKVTLVEIGAGGLPVVTPVVRRRSSWFPKIYVPPAVPPVDGVVPNSVADGVLIEWAPVDQEGGVYIIERGPSETGPWTEIARVTETRYLYSDGSGLKWWFRITASVRGKVGEGTVVEGAAGRVPSYAEMEELNRKFGQEILDRLAGDLDAINQATGQARAYTDAQVAALNGILEDIVGADEWTAEGEYPLGDFVRHRDVLYRALQPSTGVEPGTNAAVWEAIGDYTSVGDALAASISMGMKNASDIQAEASRTDAVMARMPAGNGRLATDAQVASEQLARVDGDTALGQRVDSTNAALGGKASTARVDSVEQASVSRDDALGQRINTTNAALAGKASTDALQQLRSDVGVVDGKTEANSAAITQVSVKVPASPQEIIRLGRFTLDTGVGLWQTGVVQGDPGHASGFVLRVGGNNGYEGGVADAVPCSPGEIIDLSADCYGGFMPAGTGSYFALQFLNATGQTISHVYPIYCAGGSTWRYRGTAAVTVPTGACRVRGVLFAGTSGYALWQDLSAKRRTVSEAANASATQALSVRATQLENGQSVLMAQYNVVLDVNGRIVGQRAVNDGRVGRWDFVADIFSITDPNNTGSTTFEQGRWITRSGGYMLAHGKPFGTTGDLMMWLGVGSDPAVASKANGMFWIDNKGNGYFGGSLSAGTLRNAVQTTTIQTVGTQLENGPFTTNGGVRQVVLSFSRQIIARKNAGGAQGFVAGPGENRATIQLYRKIGTGAETLFHTMQVGGQLIIRNEADAPDQLQSIWAGSMTVSDSSPSTSTVYYRAVITALEGQAYSHQSGSWDSTVTTQNLAIISVEQ